MIWILQVAVLIVVVKLAFDFVANTTRIADSLENIAKAMQYDKPAKHKETEKEEKS
ncbi:MAG TPA: hypothetical protein VIM53_04285 [Candidatus Saccharimonadales bacterium]